MCADDREGVACVPVWMLSGFEGLTNASNLVIVTGGVQDLGTHI